MTGDEPLRPVESVVQARLNGPLIEQAARLWLRPHDEVLDVTYGKGLFWTRYRPESLVAHDLYEGDGVDFRQLPELDGSVDVVVFDPPYVTPGGRETSTLAAHGSDFFERYGLDRVAANPEANRPVIAAGIKEATRVLRVGSRGVDGRTPGGRLLVKCMDFVWSGNFQQGHYWVLRAAEDAGLVQVDEFIHHSGLGPQPKLNPDGSTRRQVHSRRAHTVLAVFQKQKGRAS